MRRVAIALLAMPPLLAGLPAASAQPSAPHPTVSAGGPLTTDRSSGDTTGSLLWREIEPDVVPERRSDFGMAYDSAEERVVLYGGSQQGEVYLDDTWIWDGTSWTDLGPSPIGPRSDAAMAYDAARGEVILFGGETEGGAEGDTWALVGDTWERRSPAQSPPATSSGEMVYDPVRREVVLVSKGNGSTQPMQTWIWDGSTWARVRTDEAPSNRLHFGLGWDERRKAVVVAGGWNEGGSWPTDSWAWNGDAWTQIDSMPARSFPAVGTDGRRLVVFGGDGPGTPEDDTLVLRRGGWTEARVRRDPAPRVGASMVYDAARDQAVLFGGSDSGFDLNDMWVLRRRTP